MREKRNDVRILQIVLTIALAFVSASAFAFPHHGEVFSLVQPNGTYVDCKVYGDEFYQDVETPDGFTLLRDPGTGWICYAEPSTDGESYVSSGIVYDPKKQDLSKEFKLSHVKKIRMKSSARERIRKHNHDILYRSMAPGDIQPAPADSIQLSPPAVTVKSGTYTGLAVLIDFPDKRGTISKQDIDDFCNQAGYSKYSNNGSVRDYFAAISDNALTYVNKITDYITTNNNFSYYDQNCELCKVTELINEILTKLKNSGFDFSGLSTNGSQFTAINFLYAGSPTQGWAKGLWPHSSSLNGSFSVNGIKAVRYQLTNIGSELSIATYAHENCHMLLGWPDVYAYDDHDNGVGYYEEGTSSKNPALRNPYFRYLAGWCKITDISNATPGTIFSLAANQNQACYYSNRSDGKEFFMIEVKRKTGRNSSIPDEGLAIWHVNTAGDNEYVDTPNLISIEQADGKFEIENNVNSGGAGDLYHSGDKTTFNDNTTPSAKWTDSTVSGIDINSVSALGDTMTFMFKTGASITPEPTAVPTSVPTIAPTGTPNLEPIWNGGPYILNGTSDYIDLPDGFTNDLSDFSVAAWVNLNSIPNWVRIFDLGGDSNVFMMLTPKSGNTGYPYFCITTSGNAGEQGINGTAALPTGSWQHLAVVKSGTTGVLYINAQEVGRNTGITLNPSNLGNTTNNYIGRSQWTQDPYLSGSVDNFVVYNRALSVSEITTLGSVAPGGTTPELTPAPTADPGNGLVGDANGNGTVDIVDALLVAQYYVGLNPSGFIAANSDVNCSGAIDIIDALLVAQYYVGLIANFPC